MPDYRQDDAVLQSSWDIAGPWAFLRTWCQRRLAVLTFYLPVPDGKLKDAVQIKHILSATARPDSGCEGQDFLRLASRQTVRRTSSYWKR